VKRRPFKGRPSIARSSITADMAEGWVSTSCGAPETVTVSLGPGHRELEIEDCGPSNFDVNGGAALPRHARSLNFQLSVSGHRNWWRPNPATSNGYGSFVLELLPPGDYPARAEE